MTTLEPAPIDAWVPWTPSELAERLAPTGIQWCVVGGWSIDLHVGRVTRQHEDLEFAVLRKDDGAVRVALRELEAFTPSEHVLHHLPFGGERRPETHQTWMLDVTANEWRVDVMLEPGDAETWVYRRDESLSAPRAFMEGRTPDGIPYLRPHGSLFFKAKYVRDKDQHDFDQVASTLGDDERSWLIDALARYHPGHVWLGSLASAAR